MPLSPCRIIAAYNRCASGVRAALPTYPFPRLTLTSGMSQFGPASGSLKETRGHIMTVACKRGLSVYLSHFPPPEKQKPRRVAGLIVSFIWMYVSMIRSIHDNFGQNQVLCTEKAKYCRHCFKSWSLSEIPYRHGALPSSIRPPAHRRRASSYGSMF